MWSGVYIFPAKVYEGRWFTARSGDEERKRRESKVQVSGGGKTVRQNNRNSLVMAVKAPFILVGKWNKRNPAMVRNSKMSLGRDQLINPDGQKKRPDCCLGGGGVPRIMQVEKICRSEFGELLNAVLSHCPSLASVSGWTIQPRDSKNKMNDREGYRITCRGGRRRNNKNNEKGGWVGCL